ncbi:uracil-DNA glycosylase family protein [Erythrobacter sp. F6033]|uniref:uracil-DNA glycosylase family protein n=1 Tax=Erythrobacter sp. F6033 TaxID=2926401 RepID=UPI001FF6C3F3|nr:uracil-DNA glycosylase family protein [Erythrobacter sp. F6033]MCK0128231.1 hypothetical protein [Erythrobacter sp. F6033]
MNAISNPLARDLAATMDWWRNAGVDMDFADDATVWLSEDEPAEAASTPPKKPQDGGQSGGAAKTEKEQTRAPKVQRIDLIGDSPPASLEEFRTFWMEAPGLDAIGPRGRIAPRGNANAETMVLVCDPEERDSDTILSGPQGELLNNMLAAMGLAKESVYVASALPRHTPMADTSSIAQSGMDAVTALHIQLVAPKRVIAFGANILPFFGHDRSQEFTSLREINHTSVNTPLLMSEGLDAMMSMPRLKARFWRRWIEWSAGK